MSFVNFVHLRSFPQFYPHRWISRHIGLSLICMSLIFLRFSFPLPLPQLYNTAFYCVSKTLTANCEPTFMTARLPACLEQDITIYRILCNRYHLLCMYSYTDYGRPMKSFFLWNLKLLGLAGQIVQIDFGAFGVFLNRFISIHFGTVSPLSMFSINQPLFLQKTKPLCISKSRIFIWDWYLNLGRKELDI